jgi:hypothetical protein
MSRSLALIVVVLAAPAHAFLLMTSCTRMPLRLQPQHHVRMHAHECATRSLEPSVTVALEGGDRVTRAAAIRSATATLLGCTLAPPAFAGTVMVGGEAVGAEEEMDDDAYEALESSGGPLDFILEKVSLKKLGVGAGALLLADVISGLVMGRSFLKIVSGNADPGKLATRARAHMLWHAHKFIYTSVDAQILFACAIMKERDACLLGAMCSIHIAPVACTLEHRVFLFIAFALKQNCLQIFLLCQQLKRSVRSGLEDQGR